jgi:hypothetical protein
MATIPSLALIPSGYKANKLYSVLPTDGSGDLTFTRAADTATRVNSDGLIELVLTNVPRLNYPLIDGVVQGCPSLLLEPARTNLALYSEDLSNAAWIKTRSTIVSDDTISPDGTQNADKLVEDTTASNSHTAGNNVTVGNVAVTGSVFVKADTRSRARVAISDLTTGDYRIDLNLNNESVLENNGGSRGSWTNNSYKIEKFPNNWYKVSLTGTKGAGAQASLAVWLLDDNGNSSYTGDGTSGLFVWGSQLEAGSYPTSYIPTSGATSTRGADAASKTGISSLIGQTEGTIFIEFDAEEDTPQNVNLINFNNSTQASVVIAKRTSGVLRAQVFAGGSAPVDIDSAIVSGKTKAAIAYKSGDSVLYVNGVGVSDSSTFTFNGTLSDVIFPSYMTYFAFGHKYSVNQALLFKTRLTNAQLAELTTI